MEVQEQIVLGAIYRHKACGGETKINEEGFEPHRPHQVGGELVRAGYWPCKKCKVDIVYQRSPGDIVPCDPSAIELVVEAETAPVQ